MQANINHFAYTATNFHDLIEQAGLKGDFDAATTYLNGLVNEVYPAAPISTQLFGMEKDYQFVMPAELSDKIAEHETRMGNLQEWKSSDADLITQYNKNFGDFKKVMGGFIPWHIKVIGERNGQLWNEVFEMKMGVNVRERTISDK